MKRSIVQSVMAAAALLLCASLSLAAENKAGVAGETKAIGNLQATEKGAKPKPAKAAAKVKLVDINSANKAELKTLPGIGDAEAEKIIAGRPYGSKAHLTTRGIIPRGPYDNLKDRVVARQKQESAAKPAKK